MIISLPARYVLPVSQGKDVSDICTPTGYFSVRKYFTDAVVCQSRKLCV